MRWNLRILLDVEVIEKFLGPDESTAYQGIDDACGWLEGRIKFL
jgi:hypothetical protein